MTEAITNDKLVKAYLKMRAAKSELTKEFKAKEEALNKQMSLVEGLLLKFLLDNKSNSMGTDVGTFYKERVQHVRCDDWEAYHAWLIANQTLDGLEKRVGKTFVLDYAKDNDDTLPPGIVVQEEYVVRVRVPTK